MTSPDASSPRRPQLVTALLVGAVVIVLGVASGLGVDTSTSATPVTTVTTGVTPAAAPSAPTRAPIQYVGVGTTVPPADATVPTPPTSAPSRASAPSVSTPRAASTSSSVTPAPPVAAVTCSSNLVSALLDALLGNPISGGGLTSLLGGVVGGLLRAVTSNADPVGGLFASLTGAAQASAGASSSDLVSVVTRLLPGALRTTATPAPNGSRPLATACAHQLSGTLPLLAGLR